MKRIYQSFIALIPIILFAGCATTATYNDVTVEENFRQENYMTYAILPAGEKNKEKDVYDQELLNQMVHNEISQQMEQLGYRMDADNPDLLVHIDTRFKEKTETYREPVYNTYTYYTPNNFYVGPWYDYYYNDYTTVTRVSGYEVEEVPYTDASIVVDIIDAKDNEIVWRGWAEDEVGYGYLQNNVRNYVQNIFDQYPEEAEYISRM